MRSLCFSYTCFFITMHYFLAFLLVLCVWLRPVLVVLPELFICFNFRYFIQNDAEYTTTSCSHDNVLECSPCQRLAVFEDRRNNENRYWKMLKNILTGTHPGNSCIVVCSGYNMYLERRGWLAGKLL